MNTSELKARYRNKLKKIIIEVWNGEKWIYVKTLADPLIEFNAECLEKVSSNSFVFKEKQAQKFGQSLLTEQSKQDTNKHIPTEEEIKKLWEITKE